MKDTLRPRKLVVIFGWPFRADLQGKWGQSFSTGDTILPTTVYRSPKAAAHRESTDVTAAHVREPGRAGE